MFSFEGLADQELNFYWNLSLDGCGLLWIRIQWGPWIRIRTGFRRTKMTHKLRKMLINFIFLSARCLFWGLKASPVAWTQVNCNFHSEKLFLLYFFSSVLFFKILDPDWIRIRIGSVSGSVFTWMLNLVNPDPHLWLPVFQYFYLILIKNWFAYFYRPALRTSKLQQKP